MIAPIRASKGLDVPLTSDELLAKLAALGIAVSTVSHPPLRTVEDAKRLRGDLPGGHVKNLFLRDKRERFWLLVALEDTAIDLKAVAKRLDAGRFSFANEQQLGELLGIAAGAVSPFAVINDTGGTVLVVLDDALLGIDPLNLHPLRNDRTTAIAPRDLLRFLEDCGHAPRILAFAGADAAP
ncbi:MAG: prolyl-tRNA synthetase associated domain-containing protein [Proteobacteria bacterium]|nr:prolyl-tRNA synthetase associated domain-containing protein [Pseudomonadota bacterium]